MKKTALILVFSLITCFSAAVSHAAGEKWQGVDETVVGKYAEEHGRPPKPHLIELTGDALLFAFLVAGAAGGFTMGYYYRDLTTKKAGGGKTDAD